MCLQLAISQACCCYSEQTDLIFPLEVNFQVLIKLEAFPQLLKHSFKEPVYIIDNIT